MLLPELTPKMDLKSFSPSNSDSLSCANSSNESSVIFLKERLRNTRIPTLQERLATFDRRLEWNEWKWRLHQENPFLPNDLEEQEEITNATNPSSKPIKTRQSKTTSHHGRRNHDKSFSELTKDSQIPTLASKDNCKPLRTSSSSDSSYKTSKSSTPRLQHSHQNLGYTQTTVEKLKKQVASAWQQSHGEIGLPLLPDKHLGLKAQKYVNSRHLQHADSDWNDAFLEPSSQRDCCTSRKTRTNCDADLVLPPIKSRSTSDRNVAFETFDSHRQLAHFISQFQSRYQLPKSKPLKSPDSRIEQIYLRKSSEGSSWSSTRNHHERSCMSTPKNGVDSGVKYFDYLDQPGFYTDRPKASKKSSLRPLNGDGKKRVRASSDLSLEIPLLNIRSLSNSMDSGDTYKVHSTKRVYNPDLLPEPKSSGSNLSNGTNGCTCFRISDSSREGQISSRSDASKVKYPYAKMPPTKPAKRLRRSRIPVRVKTEVKKEPSPNPSPENTSPSTDRSDNSHVSEYESKTMIVVTTSSHGLPKPNIPAVENGRGSLIYHVSISNEDKPDLTHQEKVQILVPTLLMNMPQNLNQENPQVKCLNNGELSMVKEEGSIYSEGETYIIKDSKDDGLKAEDNGIKVEDNLDEPEVPEMVESVEDENQVPEINEEEVEEVEEKVEEEVRDTSGDSEDKKEEETRAYLPIVKSGSVTDLQSKAKEEQVKTLTSSASLPKLNSPKKNAQNRFPFTISQARELDSRGRNECQLNGDKETPKHPSLMRLASIGLEPNYSDIINYLSFNPREEKSARRNKGFWRRLKSKFKKNQMDYTIFPDETTIKSGDTQGTLRNTEIRLQDDDWIREFHSMSEISIFPEFADKNLKSLGEKSQKQSTDANKEDPEIASRSSLQNESGMDTSFYSRGCLCFKWH